MGNKGIPGFVVDVNMDDRVKLLQAEFGKMRSKGILISLWQKIYATDYYLEWTKEVELLFSDEIQEGVNFVSEFVKAAVRRGLFNKNLFEKYNVLTSRRIQEHFFKYVERRKRIEIFKKYLLTFDILKNPNVCILDENVNNNTENVCNFELIKLNQIKSKDKSDKLDKSIPDINVNDLNYLTQLLVKNDYISLFDVDLINFEEYFKESLEVNEFNDCLKVTSYIIKNAKKNMDKIENKFAYFKKSFKEGLKNLSTAKLKYVEQSNGNIVPELMAKFDNYKNK